MFEKITLEFQNAVRREGFHQNLCFDLSDPNAGAITWHRHRRRIFSHTKNCGMQHFLNWQVKKNVNFPVRRFPKQKCKFNHWPFISGYNYMPRVPKLGPTDPKFCRELKSEVRSGFQARNGELKGSGVLGSESDNSPFQGARPKLTSYSD